MRATRQLRAHLRSRLSRTLVVTMLVVPVVVPVITPSAARADSVSDQQQKVSALADALDNLTSQMDALGENYSESLTQQADLAVQIDQSTKDVAAAEAKVGQMRGTLYTSAVSQFMRGGGGSTLGNLLASTGGIQDSLQRNQLTSIALNQGAVTTDELDSTAVDLAKKKAVLEKQQAQAKVVATNVLKRKDAAEALAAKYEQLKATAQGDLAVMLKEEQQRREAAALADAQKIAAGYQSKYASLRAQYKNIPAVSARANSAINAALSQLGTPYHYGMSEPGHGFDCSGLVTWAWGKVGVGMPRNSRAEFNALPHIPESLAQPGDLIFQGSPIHHVGIYLGGGRMVHAPQYGDGVKISPISWSHVSGVARPG